MDNNVGLRMLWVLALFVGLFVAVPLDAQAAMTCPPGAEFPCKYARPYSTSDGTDLNYGSENGSSEANAWDGLVAITGLVPGDTVCLPGSDETFFSDKIVAETYDGTAGHPITYIGCGATPALIWDARDLTGTRSFTAAKAYVTGAEYAWDTVGTDIYRKRIDRRARMLWEDSTWLRPMSLEALDEAAIIATLPAGQWGNKDNGDGTFRIYYHATSAAKSPTLATIRCNNVPSDVSSTASTVKKSYLTFQNIEFRGVTSTVEAPPLSFRGAPSNITMTDVTFERNMVGPNILGSATNYLFTRLIVNHSGHFGLAFRGFLSGSPVISNITVVDSTFSNTEMDDNGVAMGNYTGTTFTFSDGDGVGIGFEGGAMSNITFINVTANNNFNYGIYSGTIYSFSNTDFTVKGATMIGNRRGCLGMDGASWRGTTLVSGLLCVGSAPVSAHPISTDPSPAFFVGSALPPVDRTIKIINSTFVNNRNDDIVNMPSRARNNYILRNLVFASNPGLLHGKDYGDLNGTNVGNLIGDEVLDKIWFYSNPNQNRAFAKFGTAQTLYKYNSGTDLATLSALVTASNLHLNEDPLLSLDYKPAAGSPLLNTGTPDADCFDVHGVACDGTPDVGAYQEIGADPPPAPEPAPAAPTGLKFAGPVSTVEVQLLWVPNTESDLAGYKVYQGSATNQGVLVKTITFASAAADHLSMTQWRGIPRTAGTYYYTVAAFDVDGNISAKSNEISVTVTGMPARTARP